jgi:hypothetical protein
VSNGKQENHDLGWPGKKSTRSCLQNNQNEKGWRCWSFGRVYAL